MPAPPASSSAPSSAAPIAAPSATAAPTVLEPLTGIAVAPGTTSLTNPSIASKIDNHVAARPQIGLEYADIVYEELVEGGITRYVAVWQSTIPKLYGPVRSIRGMDPDIVSPLRGIITYSGGQPIFVAGMHDTPVVNVVHGSAGTADVFYRTSSKIAPHNVIVRAPVLLSEFGARLTPPARQYFYARSASGSSAWTDGTATGTITDVFSTASTRQWRYDAASHLWMRSQDGRPDLDEHGEQRSAVNVVTLRVTTTTVSGTPKTILTGRGEAWVSTEHRTVHGTWSKTSKTAKLVLRTDAGDPLELAPGITWVELVPRSGSVSFR